jgi:hypothetical protein
MKAERIMSRIREARDGGLNSSRFGERMRGHGEYWKAIEQLFRIHSKRLGFNRQPERGAYFHNKKTFRRPTPQGELFD